MEKQTTLDSDSDASYELYAEVIEVISYLYPVASSFNMGEGSGKAC